LLFFGSIENLHAAKNANFIWTDHAYWSNNCINYKSITFTVMEKKNIWINSVQNQGSKKHSWGSVEIFDDAKYFKGKDSDKAFLQLRANQNTFETLDAGTATERMMCFTPV